MTKTLKTAAAVVAVAALAVAFAFALAEGVNKTERAECLKWQSEARQFVGYYLTSWQAAQCSAHNIEVDAPIMSGN